ncbi:MAG TPA: hypothetical protein ENK43_15125 [Planctomycetes bacterium]|nr:hypothetical protein [Planctomycetota bacterium]
MVRRWLMFLGVLAYAVGSIATAQGDALARPKYAIRAGKVLTMDDQNRVLDHVIIFVADGKIERIVPEKGAKIPDGYKVMDHSNHWVLPGFIDCHSHTATNQSGDLHDYVWLTNPGLRAGDLIQVDTFNNNRAIAGGVTTALLIPGSGTNLSGFGGIARHGARTIGEAVMRSPGSLKIAQAGNPERWYFGKGRSYMNYNLRQTLVKARRYWKRWSDFEAGVTKTRPAYDQRWEDFRLIFGKLIPASVHTQMFQVVSKSMTMLHDTFGMKLMIDHGTFDAYKAAALAIERKVYAIVGPRVWWMDEQDRTINSCAGKWWDAGLRKVGLNTDAGVLPQEDLRLQGTLSVKYGWQTYPALEGLTKTAAEILGVDDRIGIIAPGRDADLVAWTGDPFDCRSGVERVFALGRVVYEASGRRLY